jgi:hypothetical protein
MFTEATAIAYFVTLVVTAGYGAVQSFLHVPRLSYSWVPLIGLASWGIASAVFARRYS